jgi:hypothetical protein
MAHTVFMEVTDPDTTVGQHPVVTLTDGVTETIYHQLLVPNDFSVLTSAHVFIISAGTGNMVAMVASNWGEVCANELYNQHSDSIALNVYPVIINDITCVDVSAALTGIAANDLVGISFQRQGGHINDTVNANCSYLGIRLVYN